MSRIKLIVLAVAAVVVLALPALATAAKPSTIKLKPVAGRFVGDEFKPVGNSTDAQANWTNKEAETGKFSMFLQKSVPTTSPAFAAAIVEGVEGKTVADLGSLGFSVKGPCTGGSPRFNLQYDTDSDGEADGIAFYGCANHPFPSMTDYTHMFVPTATIADNGPVDPAATVISLAVLVDEQGSYYVDNVMAAGQTTGEPNGGS